MGKLAFQLLGNLICYEEDLRECDIDVKEVSVHSNLQRGVLALAVEGVQLCLSECSEVSCCFVCFSVIHRQRSNRTSHHSSV